MAKTVVLAGKQGPIFGNRNSHTELEWRDPDDIYLNLEDESVHWVRVSNWPVNDRADALRAIFDIAIDTVFRP